MFRDCCSLKKLDISNFIISDKVYNKERMFNHCLKEIQKMAQKRLKIESFYEFL